jgi:hypothetical protein
MRPNKIGQVGKFDKLLPLENQDHFHFILEIKEDIERPRADIKGFNIGSSLSPINSVLFDEIKVGKIEKANLVGNKVSFNKVDYSQAIQKVV